MALNAIYDVIDDVPESFRELYTERKGADGKTRFELTGITGIKTQADIDRIQEGARKERNDHAATREKLRQWEGLEYEDVRSKLDRWDELETAAKGKIDDTKLNEIVESRLKSKLAPVEREYKKTLEEKAKLEATIQEYTQRERQRAIHDAARTAAIGKKVLDTAVDDVLILAERLFEVADDGRVVTRDGVGVTPGLTVDDWLAEVADRKSHWWPPSAGGGARGGRSTGGVFPENPWSAEHWNMTKQGQFLMQHGQEKAAQAAKAAGSSLDAVKPPVKK